MGYGVTCFNFYDDCVVETLKMSNYMNYANQPHTVKIRCLKTRTIFKQDKFPTESKALAYLNEVREYKNNKNKFQFIITGPNMYYCC